MKNSFSKNSLAKRVARNIKYLVDCHQMSFSALEDEIECSRGYLKKFCDNDNFNPSLYTAVQLSQRLGYSLDILTNVDLPLITEQDNKVVAILEKLRDDTLYKKTVWNVVQLNMCGTFKIMSESLEEQFQYQMLDYKTEYVDNEGCNVIEISTKNNFDSNNKIALYSASVNASGTIYKCSTTYRGNTFFLVVGNVLNDVDMQLAYELYLCDDTKKCYPLCSSGYDNNKSIFSVYLENLYMEIRDNFSNIFKSSPLESIVDSILEDNVNSSDVEFENLTRKEQKTYICPITEKISGTKVYSFILANKEHINFKNDWSGFLKKLTSVLYKENSIKMKELAKEHWIFKGSRGRRPAITNYIAPDSKKWYFELQTHPSKIYVCTNYSNSDSRDFAYALIKEFGYDEDSLVINVFDKN